MVVWQRERRLVWHCLWALGIMALGLILLDLLRALSFFSRIHSWAAVAAGMGMAALGLAFARLLYRDWTLLGGAGMPPVMGDDWRERSHPALRGYCRQWHAYLRRLARNPQLGAELKAVLGQQAADIADTLGAHPLNDDLRRQLEAVLQAVVPTLQAALDEARARAMRQAVRDVMLACALSPRHTGDLLVLGAGLWRLGQRLVHLVAGALSLREQVRLAGACGQTVAALDLPAVRQALLVNLDARWPIKGPGVDDVRHGLEAGVVVAAGGYAVWDRLGALRPWSPPAAAACLAARGPAMLREVGEICVREVLPILKPRLLAAMPETVTAQPGFWDTAGASLPFALEAAGHALALSSPAAPVANPVYERADSGAAFYNGHGGRAPLPRAGSAPAAPRRRHRTGHRKVRGIGEVWSTFIQRIKYSKTQPD